MIYDDKFELTKEMYMKTSSAKSLHPGQLIAGVGRRRPTQKKLTAAKLEGEPIADRIIVVPIEVSEMAGSIVIPDVAREQPRQGQVIAVGPGRWLPDGKRQPMEVKTGDRILFGKFSGSAVNIADVSVLVMREEEVIMRFPPVSSYAQPPRGRKRKVK